MNCPFCRSVDIHFERVGPEDCRVWCNTCPAMGWKIHLEDDEDNLSREVQS